MLIRPNVLPDDLLDQFGAARAKAATTVAGAKAEASRQGLRQPPLQRGPSPLYEFLALGIQYKNKKHLVMY